MNQSVSSRILPLALCAVSLAVGAFAGVAYSRRGADRESAAEPAATPKAHGRVADLGEKASADALRARIRELERQLAAAKSAEAPAESAVAAAEPERRREEGRRERDPAKWMEQLRKSDPERFAQMTNRIATWRRQHFDRTASRIGTLSAIDTSKWSQEAKNVHAEYMELIARREELMDEMNPEKGDAESRIAAMQEMRENFGRLHELQQTERDNLLRETARSFGLGDGEAGEFAETVRGVLDVTSDFGGQHGGGRHGGHGQHGGGRHGGGRH